MYFNRAYYHKKDKSFAYFEQPLKNRVVVVGLAFAPKTEKPIILN